MDLLSPIKVESTVRNAYPDFRLLCVAAEDLDNGPSDELSAGMLRDAEQSARKTFANRPVPEHPHVAAWRGAYSSFGSKPSKYFSSIESLLRRVVKGDQLPSINRAVDAYNAVSVSYVLPVGAEDRDKGNGPLRLYIAGGNEKFDLPDGTIERPEAGEVVWGDEGGVTCRRWNWRQGARTRIEEDTTRAVFVLERLSPYPIEQLQAAGARLTELLQEISPTAKITSRMIVE